MNRQASRETSGLGAQCAFLIGAMVLGGSMSMAAGAAESPLGEAAATVATAPKPAQSAYASASAPAVRATVPSGSKALEVGPRWSELSSAQRSLLGPIEHEWPRMDERRKQKWLGMAVRLANVGPDERERIRARMTEWASLSPQQRSQMRLRYQEARQVAPKSRQDRWAAYQALPPEERQKLAALGSHPHAASAASGADRGRPRSNAGAIVTRKPVAPTVVQAQPGATTSLMSRGISPPLHVKPGMPHIAASPTQVDSATLLPKRPGPTPGAVVPVGAGVPADHD